MQESLLSLLTVFPALIVSFVVARGIFGVFGRLQGYNLKYESVVNDNPAVLLREISRLAAFLLTLIGIIHPSGLNWIASLDLIAKYALLYVIPLLIISSWVNDKCILYEFDNTYEVVKRRNVAVALVEAGTFLGSYQIMVGALTGWHGGIFVSLVWFALGQLLFIALGFLYRVVAGKETFGSTRNWVLSNRINSRDLASASSLAGFLLAGGQALGYAVSGPFEGWKHDLSAVGLFMLVWIGVMIVTHLVTDKVVLAGSSGRKEIVQEQNVGAGIAEGLLFVVFTYALTQVWG